MSMFCFSLTAGQPAVEKYEMSNFIFTVQNAFNSQLLGKILSRDICCHTWIRVPTPS